MNGTLAFILHFVVASTMMGIAVIVMLSAGYTDGHLILLGAIAGFVVAVPVSWLIARQLTRLAKS